VRWKSWKLRVVDGKTALYNLAEDIGEKTNLVAEHPELVLQLQSAMQAFKDDMTANVRPAGHVEYPKPLTKTKVQP
jgi:hypothetical protein